MESTGTALLPLLRSRVQGDMLAVLFLEPERSYSLTDMARRIRASVRAVHAEANRLVSAGLLREQRIGNNRMLSAETDSLLARPLTDLLAVTYGPLPLLTDALSAIPGIESAFIYGSWAARYQGRPGHPPADVDLLIVGTADPDDVQAAVEPSARRLRREVQVRHVRPEVWARPADDPFLESVRSRPLVELRLTGDRM